MIKVFYKLVTQAVNRYPKDYDAKGYLINNRPHAFAVIHSWEDLKLPDLGKRYEHRGVFHFFSRLWARKKYPTKIEVDYPLVYALEISGALQDLQKSRSSSCTTIELGVVHKYDLGKDDPMQPFPRWICQEILLNVLKYVFDVNYYSNGSSGIWLLDTDYAALEDKLGLVKDEKLSRAFLSQINSNLSIELGTLRSIDNMHVASTRITICDRCVERKPFEAESCYDLSPKPCCG